MLTGKDNYSSKSAAAARKRIRNICILVIPILVLCAISIRHMPSSWKQPGSYKLDQEALYNAPKDFELREGVLISTSKDPWLMVNPNYDSVFKGVEIDVSSLNVDQTRAQVFYETKTTKGFREAQSCWSALSVGKNRLLFPTEAVGNIRLDLTNETDVKIALQEVSLLIPDKGISSEGVTHILDLIAMYLCFVIFFAIRKKETMPREKERIVHRKKHILSFDFIRAVSTVGIVFYHFAWHTQCPELAKFKGPLGDRLVTVFFILSGASLMYQHDSMDSFSALKSFYYARCKSIFPAFYIAFFLFFLEKAVNAGTIYYSRNFILTTLGMDGYFHYLAPNYYILGEWFLGAILLIYLLYPILLKGMQSSSTGVLVLSFILYFLVLKTSLFRVSSFRNLLSCIFSFCIGMYFMKNNERIQTFFKRQFSKAILCVFLFALYLFLTFQKPSLSWLRNSHLYGTVLFFALYFVGNTVMRLKPICKAVKGIAEISYPTFLLHHVLMNKFLAIRNPESLTAALGVLAVVFITVFISARSLLLFTKYSMGQK